MAIFVWAAAVGGNWSTGSNWKVGGVAQANPPTSADDVLFGSGTGATQQNCTVTGTANCRSIDFTGYTGSFTINTAVLVNIGDGSGGALKIVSGMGLTNGGNFVFVSTSNNGGAGWSITSAGKTLGTLVFNGAGGRWTLQDALTVGSASSLTLTAGTLDTNAKAVTCQNFISTGNAVRSLVMGSSAGITCSGTTTVWSVSGSNFSVSASGTSTITLSGTTYTFAGNGVTYNNLTLSAMAGACVINGANTFNNLTLIGTALKTCSLTLGADQTVTTFQPGGNTTQGVNRLLIQASVRGTQRTITMTGGAVVISGDVDFMDIAIAGSPSWTNTGSKFIGDCLGNGSLITTNRTTPAAQTYNGSASDNWSTLARWTSRVPLPQDNVVVVAVTAGTLTVDMPRLGADVDFTGTTRNVSITSNVDVYGSLTLASGMTVAGTANITLSGRSTHTLTTNGLTVTYGFVLNGPGGTYTQLDALTCSKANALSLTQGTWTDGGFTNTFTNAGANVSIVNTNSTLNKTGAWSFSTTNAVTFFSSGASPTINDSGSWTLTQTSANTRTFDGGGHTFGTLTYVVAGSTGQLTILGVNIFNTINFSDVTNARTLSMPTATNTTVTTFNVNGTSGKLMSVVGDVSSSVRQSCDYLNVSSSDATGTWYAGANSTDGGSNTGWIFRSLTVLTGAGAIASSFASGAPTLTDFVAPTGVATGFASGTPALTEKVAPTGIATGFAGGIARLTETVVPTGIASAQGVGVPRLTNYVIVAGIASGEAVGTPTLKLNVVCVGIASQEGHGTARLTNILMGIGIGSAEAVGIPAIVGATYIFPSSIVSRESFGLPKTNIRLVVVGIASTNAFGVASVYFIFMLRRVGVQSKTKAVLTAPSHSSSVVIGASKTSGVLV